MTVEVEEMLHYASPANGDIHMVVTIKIMCFPTPADLPADNRADTDAPSGGVVRIKLMCVMKVGLSRFICFFRVYMSKLCNK